MVITVTSVKRNVRPAMIAIRLLETVLHAGIDTMDRSVNINVLNIVWLDVTFLENAMFVMKAIGGHSVILHVLRPIAEMDAKDILEIVQPGVATVDSGEMNAIELVLKTADTLMVTDFVINHTVPVRHVNRDTVEADALNDAIMKNAVYVNLM